MLKMSSQIETIVNAYKTLAKIPAVAGGKLNAAGNKVTGTWSVRNLDKGKSTKYLHNYTLDGDLKVVSQSDFGTDVSNELLSSISPTENLRAVIREETVKDAKKQYLEVWGRSTLQHCMDLTALDLHGDVYADSEFGSLDWFPDASALVYIAEKKLPKSEPYIKRKQEKAKADGSGEPAPKKGAEFEYKQDWGEQLVGKHLSVIVVFTLHSESFKILEGLPEDWCPGQVRVLKDGSGVVGVAWPTEPRRLGLIFCTNRPGYIFTLTFEGLLSKLSSEGHSVRSPRLSPNGDLVWMQRTAGGPHHACHELVILKKGSTTPSTLISVVDTEVKSANGCSFHGIYGQSLPARCFTNDGRRIVFSTPQKNEVRTYVVDVDSGRLVDISGNIPRSTSVLDVSNDVILAACSNLTTPGQLEVARVPPQGAESDTQWLRVSTPAEDDILTTLASSTTEYLHLEHKDSEDSVKSFSALYLAPSVSAGKKLPLIVWPHGGPHSNFVNAYSLEAAFYNMLGFASIQINYRGSTGAGQASVEYLPKRVGDADVKDCKLATDIALNKYPIDANAVCLSGGSHGGFLVTHLSGQYPDVYKVVVIRNPVIDLATMYNSTDIADWSDLTPYYVIIQDPYHKLSLPLWEERAIMLIPSKAKIFQPGFVSIRINFRGSTGQGDACVHSLIRHVGDYDVQDCYLALSTVLERETTSSIVLMGGSYGGLVAAHLAGRYDVFKAMVLRNPLIDLATKGNYADNSDGCAVEAGFEFTEQGPVSEDHLLAMRRCSPLVHVHRVKAPTALLLGLGDKRVPHYQGLEYARRLKANGVPTKIYMYEDNHSLSSPPAEMDSIINGADWLLQHIQL